MVFVRQHGTPPLLIAAGCGNIQIIEVLMRKGAEIQAGDKVTTARGVWCVCDSAVETGLPYICTSRRNATRTFYFLKTFRVVPTQSTTQRDTAMWRPWDSSTKRNALWISKTRWIKWRPSSPSRVSMSYELTHTCSKVHKYGLLLGGLGFLSTSNDARLFQTITLVFQNVQTHRFTLTTLSTWRENRLLWHFISLFAVAIETGFAGEDCVRVCVCVFTFSTGASHWDSLQDKIPKAFRNRLN